MDGWISASCGTKFQFGLKKPAILAVESIEEGNVVGLTLQQALEAGALENVKAIVIGKIDRGRKQIGDEIEKYPALQAFIEQSNIAVFTTNANLADGGIGSFGHGGAGISQPIANFAQASIAQADNGTYGLTIVGKRSKENLDFYYQSSPAMGKKDEFFSQQHATIDAPIYLKKEHLQLINGDLDSLADAPMLCANYRAFRLANATPRQMDAANKIVIVSASDAASCEQAFLHESLVENYLSGAFVGAKAIIVALPDYQKESTLETLKILTNPLPYQQIGHHHYRLENLPQGVFDHRLKPDLDKIKDGAIQYQFDPAIGVTIEVTNGDLLEQTRRELHDKALQEMLRDAANRYFPNTPIYMALDDKLVQDACDQIALGQLKFDRSINALDLAQEMQKPSSTVQCSEVKKMVGQTMQGGYEMG